MLHLIDASPYIFRSYFALPDTIRDPEGHAIHAVYGFASFLVKYVNDHRPTHVAVAFDRSLNSSFRNDVYPPYKAQREQTPADLEAQLDACGEFATAFGMQVLIEDRYEADDLIATALHQLRVPAVIVTIDKDLAQLVTTDVTMFDIGKEKRYEIADVVEKFGVRPEQIPDYLGLCGDAVDNIPGVKGVGPKSAAELLRHFETLQAMYDDIELVGTLPLRGAKSLQMKLVANRDVALLSKQLATVSCDAPIEVRLDDLVYEGPDHDKVTEFCHRLGIGTLRERALGVNGSN